MTFCEIARRVFVLSQLSQKAVRERASWILNRELFVPQSETADALDELARLVRDANKSNQDIAAPIVEKARSRARSLLLSPTRPHVARVEEPGLFDELQQRHALLLTGLSYAGKTHAARSVATRYQREGYSAEEEGDIRKAHRFFRDTVPEDRILLLDDPFGSLTPARDAHQTLRLVRDMLSDVSPHRKLIITSRADILRELLGDPPWQVDGYSFHDISLTDAALARSIWGAHASVNSVDMSVISRVDTLLHSQRPEELLQPGQLRQLARNIGGSVSNEALVQIARQDGRDLGKALSNDPAVRDVLAALRMLASTALPVRVQELFFVLSDTSDLPGKDHSKGRAVSIGGPPMTAAPVFPEYKRRYDGTREQLEALDLIERRGLIERVKDGYRFSHSNYMEAAEQALRGTGGAYFQRLLEWCKRSLFCLHPNNATHAASTLKTLFDGARTSDERSEVISIAFEAFETSLFPAVRDRCLIWLLSHRDILDKERYERLLGALRYSQASEDRVVWHEGEAWLDPRPDISFNDPFSAAGGFRHLDGVPSEARDAWKEARQGARLLPEFLWALLYCQRPDDVDPDILQRASLYNETFVRARAAKIALKCHPAREDLAQRALSDDHPKVFAAGVEGLLSRWGKQDDEARKERIQQVLTAEMTSERATAVLALLEGYEEVGGWYGGTPLPAEPWALLAASALRAVSPTDQIDDTHLDYYARRVLPVASMSQAVDVLWAWIEWAERTARVRQLGSDACSVGNLWLRVTGSDASQRLGVVERLLTQDDTAFFVSVVCDMVDGWELLDDRERALVLSALNDARSDGRWARALVLTCRYPPAEIVAHLLGSGEALRSMLGRRSEPVDRRILDDCVRVCEDVADIVNLTITEAFSGLVVRLSAEPRSPLFVRALRLCIEGRTGRWGIERWSRRIWLKLCCEADAELRETLFQQLIQATVTSNSGHFAALWRVLLGTTSSDATIERWAERIDYFLEAIHNADIMMVFLSHERIAPVLYPRIPRDIKWFRTRRQAHSEEEIRLLVSALYADGAPRLLRVHDQILEAIGAERSRRKRDESAPDPLAGRVREARLRSLDTGHSRQDEVRDAPRPPVEEWTWLCDIANEAV